MIDNIIDNCNDFNDQGKPWAAKIIYVYCKRTKAQIIAQDKYNKTEKCKELRRKYANQYYQNHKNDIDFIEKKKQYNKIYRDKLREQTQALQDN